jgi:hypothetical protein
MSGSYCISMTACVLVCVWGGGLLWGKLCVAGVNSEKISPT